MKQMAIASFDIQALPAGSTTSFSLSFEGPDGSVSSLPVNVVNSSEPGPTLLVLAGVHGDEYEGVQTAIHMLRDLQPHDIRGTLIVVPVVNMLSYEGISRTTPADGRNLAREFPGDPNGTITQRLAYHLHEKLIRHADFLLDLHSGGTNYAVPELVGYYMNDDVEVGRRSRAAADAFGMEVVWGHPEVAPGRTVSSATALGIPWLYTEGFGGRRIRPEEERHYREGAYRLMAHLGMLLDPQRGIGGPPRPIVHRIVGDGNFDLSIESETSGFFIPEKKLLDRVTAGERIGAIYDWDGTEKEAVTAPGDGLLIMLTGTPRIEKGHFLYMLTKTED